MFIMRKLITVTASTSRSSLIDTLSKLYDDSYTVYDMGDQVEEILERNGASEDDSDPDEGFFVTMSDRQLQESIYEIKNLFNGSEHHDTYEIDLSDSELQLLKHCIESTSPRTAKEREQLRKLLDIISNM